MKNLFLASVTLATLIAGPATAADLPFEAPPPLPAAYYDWSGAYVGFSAGGTHYNVTHHFPSPGAITPDVTTGDHDAIFGIHAGAQWQWSTWVLGAEVARSGCNHECRSTSSVLPVSQGFEENIFGQHKIIDLLTAARAWAMRGIGCWSLRPGALPRPISRTRIARPLPVFATRPALETAS
jgi:opacity protein-like surface antigen